MTASIVFLPGDLATVMGGMSGNVPARVWKTETSNPYGGDEPIAEISAGEPVIVVYCGDEYVLIVGTNVVGYISKVRIRRENAHV